MDVRAIRAVPTDLTKVFKGPVVLASPGHSHLAPYLDICLPARHPFPLLHYDTSYTSFSCTGDFLFEIRIVFRQYILYLLHVLNPGCN